jgi:hypothetical protein
MVVLAPGTCYIVLFFIYASYEVLGNAMLVTAYKDNMESKRFAYCLAIYRIWKA